MQNVITWFDIPTVDFERARKFYSEVLGAEVRVDEHMGQKLGFFPMAGREGVGGDLLPPDPAFKPSAEGTRVYFSCEGRLDEALSRVEASGGRVVQPKFTIGEPGWIAIIEDTEGNVVGLHSSK